MKKKFAFTFIEIMIAIVIFSVWVLAVLSLVTNNLKAMDKNDLRMQATFLAKEGIELVYNLRDSNLEKELSWNCLFNSDMYFWDQDKLTSQIAWWNQSDFEDVICDWYFGSEDRLLQISFDPNSYFYLNQADLTSGFSENFENNRLNIVSQDDDFHWYWYDFIQDWVQSNFARYIQFSPVKEWSSELPQNQILKIESHVLYMKWATTGEVVFESFIWNY